MAITAEQRERRRGYIGSSDCAAIMGLDPYRSAADVWLEKTGRVDGFAGNDATDAGTLLEGAVLDWASKTLHPYARDVFKVYGARCANLDGIRPASVDDPFIVEAKTTGIVGPADSAYGEEGTDELPDRVLIQVHHQFGVCGEGYRIAWVPVLIGGVGFRMYRVDRNGDLVATVVEAAEKFWRDYVAADLQPLDYKPSLDVLKRMRRVAKLVRVIDAELGENMIVSRAVRLQAEKDEQQAQAEMLSAMGDAEVADLGDGRIITYFEFERKAYEVAAGKYRRWGFPKANKQIEAKVGAM